ncbi:DUF4905 domain-containing protein [Adhaeribacter radiodurans]|uniref:DUF4905 domain-containing protein n=1 Tax=Adhaeribacter radiodurans TaxID=2745197 RepID=A0A7L7L9F0_9BACT|nr:DUF4905 domain-containing protein [Adhaeribacter radiodurans]QMU29451.1 DUF4905 domain-containing protein [Adhaeribacter radiodurans]
MKVTIPQKQFSLTFEAPIWQIKPDYEQNLLVLELRNSDRLQVEFAVLDLSTGQIVGPFRLPENWWIGLEEASGGVLYLHGFGNRAIGTHQGITAITADSFQVKWQHEQVVFYGFANNSRILARPVKTEQDRLLAVDAQTGAILEKDITPKEAQAAIARFNRLRTVGSNFPVHHPATSEHFALLSQFILSRSGRQAHGAIDYLETEKFLILGYYELIAESKWQNILGVYSAVDGLMLLEEVLVSIGSGLSQDAFFIVNNTLLFIKEKNTLVGYSV